MRTSLWLCSGMMCRYVFAPIPLLHGTHSRQRCPVCGVWNIIPADDSTASVNVGTADFYDDAVDSLKRSETSYVVINAKAPGDSRWRMACNVPDRKALEWYKRRFAELCSRLEAQFEGHDQGMGG